MNGHTGSSGWWWWWLGEGSQGKISVKVLPCGYFRFLESSKVFVVWFLHIKFYPENTRANRKGKFHFFAL